MEHYHISKHSSFYCIGLSYEKADAELRGRFSLDEEAKGRVLEDAKEEGLEEVLVLSTCNRTEIYGFAQHPFKLINLLCKHSHGTVEEFQPVAYVFKNKEAIDHVFRVGTGLDSQILGDFEIISQLKKSFVMSRELQVVNGFTERLVNAVIQASKRIKNDTELSSGTTSVAFASVQYIFNSIDNLSEKNILLFGTGKIGRNTCDNLIKHIQNEHITVINRTKNKAEQVAGKCNVTVKDFEDLQSEINKADILIVATGANQPTITKAMLVKAKNLLVLDLSIPKNVASEVAELPHIHLVHLDQLSKVTDETLERRKEHIPMAESIIAEIKAEFNSWLETRKFAPTLKALKAKLEAIKYEEIDFQRRKNPDFDEDQAAVLSERIIQKITKHFANHLKDSNASPDESIEFITKIFQLEEALHG